MIVGIKILRKEIMRISLFLLLSLSFSSCQKQVDYHHASEATESQFVNKERIARLAIAYWNNISPSDLNKYKVVPTEGNQIFYYWSYSSTGEVKYTYKAVVSPNSDGTGRIMYGLGDLNRYSISSYMKYKITGEKITLYEVDIESDNIYSQKIFSL
jgi:hypothetical protein